ERRDRSPGAEDASAAPPTRQIVVRRRTIRAEKAACDLLHRGDRVVGVASGVDPARRMRESHTPPQTRAKAQASRAYGRLQDRAPTAQSELGGERGGSTSLSDLQRQLLTGQHSVRERFSDRFRQAVELIERDSEILLPRHRPQVTRVLAQCGVPERQLFGGKEV